MNKILLLGRLTRDPEVRYAQNSTGQMAIARYALAVNRKFKNDKGEREADFIECVAFGKAGEHAEQYFKKGMQILVSGRLQTGSYTNKEGVKIKTAEVVVEEQEFAESKGNSREERDAASMAAAGYTEAETDENGFMNIPDGVQEDLPFN